MRILFLLICLFYPLPAASDLVLQKRGQMPDQMISDTWKSAKVFVPDLSGSHVKFNEVPKETKKHPVVIFMHGCGGLNKSSLHWGKFLSELGYIAVLPDSYAISGREKYCDTKNQITNAGNANGIAVKNLRANEIRVTKDAVLKTNWADDKNLLKEENSHAQMLKVLEEVGETAGALLKKKNKEIVDGLGDSFVTLIILCYQLDLEPKDCLQAAWDEIKNRKGKTVNGTFIRE